MLRRLTFTLAMLLSLQPAAFAQRPAPEAVFTASPDHNLVTGTTPNVTDYRLDIRRGSVTGAVVFTKQLGKPTPAPTTNEIRVAVPEFLSQPNGVYVGTVAVTGPGGTTVSEPSPPFSWIPSSPAAATLVRIQ